MVSFTDKNYFLIAVIFYGLSAAYSIFLLRKGFRGDNRTNYGVLLVAAAFHTAAIAADQPLMVRCSFIALPCLTFCPCTSSFSHSRLLH